METRFPFLIVLGDDFAIWNHALNENERKKKANGFQFRDIKRKKRETIAWARIYLKERISHDSF